MHHFSGFVSFFQPPMVVVFVVVAVVVQYVSPPPHVVVDVLDVVQLESPPVLQLVVVV